MRRQLLVALLATIPALPWNGAAAQPPRDLPRYDRVVLLETCLLYTSSDHQLGAVLIRDVMVHGPMTVEAGAHVSTAAHLMATRKVGCLPVVEGSRLVGIITEVDLLRLVEQAEKHHLLDTLGASAHPHP